MRTKSESPNRVAVQFGDSSFLCKHLLPAAGVGGQLVNYIILFDIFISKICSEDCGYSNPMLAISMDTAIKWLLGELIFLIYTFIFRKKLISSLICLHSLVIKLSFHRFFINFLHFIHRFFINY